MLILEQMGRQTMRQVRQHAFTLTEIAIVIGVMGAVLGAIWVAYTYENQNRKVQQAMTEIRYIVSAVQQKYNANPNFLTVQSPSPCYNTVIACPGKPACQGGPACTAAAPTCQGGPCAAVVGPQRYVAGSCPAGCSVPPNCYGGTYSETGTGIFLASQMTANLIQSGIIPSEMISTKKSAGNVVPVITSPWGKFDFSIQEDSNYCSVLKDQAALTTIQNNGQTAALAACAGSATACSPAIPKIAAGAPTTAPVTYSVRGGTFSVNYYNVPTAACITLLGGNAAELMGMNLQSLTIGGTALTLPPTPATASAACSAAVAAAGANIMIALTFSINPQ